MGDFDYFKEENNITKKHFNLEEYLDFQLLHDIQIIRGSDYQYCCYIDKICYSVTLTPLYSLVLGIIKYKEKNEL